MDTASIRSRQLHPRLATCPSMLSDPGYWPWMGCGLWLLFVLSSCICVLLERTCRTRFTYMLGVRTCEQSKQNMEDEMAWRRFQVPPEKLKGVQGDCPGKRFNGFPITKAVPLTKGTFGAGGGRSPG